MPTPKRPIVKQPHNAHETFAPLVPAKKPKTHGTTYTPAVEISRKIFDNAKTNGVTTTDIVVALVSTGHSEIQAIDLLTQIYLLQNHAPEKAKAMATYRITNSWEDAKKTILRIAIAKTRRKS